VPWPLQSFVPFPPTTKSMPLATLLPNSWCSLADARIDDVGVHALSGLV
jgi:hypothetical protein